MKKREIVIIVIVLIFAIIGYFAISFLYKDAKYVAVKNASGDVLLKFDIYEDNYYTLEGEYGTFHIEVKNGECRAIDVVCPNHVCEGYGWMSANNPIQIICVPNNIVVMFDE